MEAWGIYCEPRDIPNIVRLTASEQDSMKIAGWFPREVPPSLEYLLDDAAIQRIIRNTEAKKPIEWQFGTDDLRIDLIWCFSEYRSLRSSKLARSRRKHLLKIAKAANDFVRLFDGELSDNEYRNQIAGALHAKIPEGRLSVGKVVSAVRTVRDIASSTPPIPSQMTMRFSTKRAVTARSIKSLRAFCS